ncbi:MAG: hypothetical protein PHP52_15100 [Bacteroidales bacterium]|nr:hypothetical protein [Bacteroidales bacterium]MDD4111162.1 hypothetical protein [Clostridia bacterium]
MCSEKDKDQKIEEIKQKFKDLNIDITPKEEFNEKFVYYKNN